MHRTLFVVAAALFAHLAPSACEWFRAREYNWQEATLLTFATPLLIALASPIVKTRSALTTTTRPLRPTPGTRTTYANGTARADAATSNPAYKSAASGPVSILTTHERATASDAAGLKSTQNTWAAAENISISWRTFPEGASYRDNYVKQVLDACSRKETGAFDVVWVRADTVGLLADCLEDLWAWNEAIAVEHGGVVARGGVVSDRLVAIPAELSFGIMLYNRELLERYNYEDAPETLEELENIATTVLAGERVLENYALSGLAGPLASDEDFMSFATEWLAGFKATVLNDAGNVTVATTPIANFLARMTSWLQAGVLDEADVGATTAADALGRWTDKRSVFLRTTTAQVPAIIADPPSFGWGVAPFPSQLESGLGVGIAEGWFVAAYRYSTNKPAAVKTAEMLASAEYQKAIILADGAAMVGTYPNFLLDRAICDRYGYVADVSLCSVYSQVSLARRPVTQAAANYEAVSAATRSSLLDVLTGKTPIITALTELDSALRVIMGQPPATDLSFGIDDNVTVVRPGKKVPDNVETQLMGLFVVFVITGVVVLLLRRKQRRDMEKELIAANPPPGQGAAESEMQQAQATSESKGKGKAGDESESLIQRSDKIEI
ncbi:hypothetical protein HDU86_007742 [Geranomyces michiganensis]|nr:hypothetical protein HDU86_007742 [Geranomyces michiganensis]